MQTGWIQTICSHGALLCTDVRLGIPGIRRARTSPQTPPLLVAGPFFY